MQFAQRVRHFRPEGAYAVLAAAQALEAQGHEVIHFEIGQPDFDPPFNATLAGIRAITQGHTRYTPPAGIPELRAAIAADAGRRRGVTISPEQVVVSPGLKPNLFFAALALLEPGDEVLYPDPGYPSYAALPGFCGAKAVPVPILEENGFSFDLEAFDQLISKGTRIILLNSPSNPTGGVIPRADLEHIAAAAIRNDCWVLSDEIYSRLAYDGAEVTSIYSLPGMAERTVLLDGFSKIYAMTGWRLGYAVMPVELAQVVQTELMHMIGSSAHFTQFAGLEALTGPQEAVDANVAVYQRRRDLIVDGLNSLPGFSCRTPQGAFYAFPNVRGLGKSSDELADFFLREAHVALLPGTSFGEYGEGYLRLSYCTSLEKIERGIERMRAALARL